MIFRDTDLNITTTWNISSIISRFGELQIWNHNIISHEKMK